MKPPSDWNAAMRTCTNTTHATTATDLANSAGFWAHFNIVTYLLTYLLPPQVIGNVHSAPLLPTLVTFIQQSAMTKTDAGTSDILVIKIILVIVIVSFLISILVII